MKVTGERAEFARSGDLAGWNSEFERDSQRGYGTLTGGPTQCEGIPVYNGRFEVRQTVINGVTAFRIKWIADQRCAIWTVDRNTCELIRYARRNFEEIEGTKGNCLVIGRTPGEHLRQGPGRWRLKLSIRDRVKRRGHGTDREAEAACGANNSS